jgi:hypothetical protein
MDAQLRRRPRMHLRRKKTIMDRAHDYVESVAETVLPQLEAALETARD